MYIHVAIDGPAGAGKSTIAKAVAKKLSIHYLDTGAMYRALGLYALRMGVDPNDGEGVGKILKDADVKVEYQNDEQRMIINGEDVTEMIRTTQVSKAASDIGVHSAVREKLVELQQAVAKKCSVVMDGRDICTIVMPDARHKFYITADPRVRAQRRLLEMRQKGMEPPSLDEIEQSIRQRDKTDTTRECNPLRKTEDSMLIDTTRMSIDESIKTVLDAINDDLREG